ncbi:hypothetical protein E1H99_07540 [Enterococcus hirae]|nr:hypothetical protein E1H99_07540 [Enterococcus hirae]
MGVGEGMRKKRPFLFFWLIGFFLLLLLSAAVSGKMTANIAQGQTEKTIASKASLDGFKKEFSTYWWKDYKIAVNYEKGELEIYLPKDKEKNQFINVNDVLSAISIRQVQHGDKNLTVLLLTGAEEKVACLKNGEVLTSYSDKVNADVIKERLNEWKKTREKVEEVEEKSTEKPASLQETNPSVIESTGTSEEIDTQNAY